MRGGTNSEKTENMEQFDDVVHTILTARLRHAAAKGPILGGRNPVSHLWLDYALETAGLDIIE